MQELHEYSGNMHMHTPYSDGEKWHKEIAEAAITAGLDFIIVTDHNIWVDGVEGYYENDEGRVLLLTGEEVHNPRRRPQASHFLAYGAEKELVSYAANPQKLIDQTLAAGGYGFLAHPHEEDLLLTKDPNYGWHDWDIENFTGLEIWNYMSSFKCELSRKIQSLSGSQTGWYAKYWAMQYVLHPEKYISRPEEKTLKKWDELLMAGHRISAVGNSDAHGWEMSMGPFKRVVFPYEFLFRAVNTHILTREPLTGNAAQDKKLILTAIGQGNAWVAYDMAHPTKGFRFTGQSITKGIMGDEIQLDAGATLQVRIPIRAHIQLLYNGEVVAEIENETNLTHIPVEAGAYRVECFTPYEGQMRGWIYSNPIYLK